MMLTVEAYLMGRDKQYPDELTVDLRINAQETVVRVNHLFGYFGEHRAVRSGWRPKAVNAVTKNAKPNSRHITCQACDLDDGFYWLHVQTVPPRSNKRIFIPSSNPPLGPAPPDGTLTKWALNNLTILEKIGLWMENPRWCYTLKETE